MLDIDENSVMVLKNVGHVAYPGMAEVGNMDLPKKLIKKGSTDMLRISDGRMSGTAYGTVVLHISPEAAIGGTLGLVENGDIIELDVPKKRLHLHVSDQDLNSRRKTYVSQATKKTRGYVRMYVEHVEQAHLGCDFDYLKGSSGQEVSRDSH